MTLRVYIVAGEPSGDALGARLLSALREGGPVEAAGVGGELMAKEGVASLFPQAETAVMGLFEVLPAPGGSCGGWTRRLPTSCVSGRTPSSPSIRAGSTRALQGA